MVFTEYPGAKGQDLPLDRLGGRVVALAKIDEFEAVQAAQRVAMIRAGEFPIAFERLATERLRFVETLRFRQYDGEVQQRRRDGGILVAAKLAAAVHALAQVL